MYSYTITYPEITARRARNGRCPVCDKRVRRSQTFAQTVSPFNRNDDGSVRTPEEVRLAVNAKADQWEPDFTHAKCWTDEKEVDHA